MPQSHAPFPKSVLVVEDDDLVMNVLREFLASLTRFSVLLTVETACAMLICERIDVVVPTTGCAPEAGKQLPRRPVPPMCRSSG